MSRKAFLSFETVLNRKEYCGVTQSDDIQSVKCQKGFSVTRVNRSCFTEKEQADQKDGSSKETISKLPFAGTKTEISLRGLSKQKYCTPEHFESKATSHLRRIDVNIARVMEGTLVELPIPVPVDQTAITAA